MGSAIAEYAKNSFDFIVYDKDEDKTMNASGLKVAGSIAELIDKSSVIILAVKPQDIDSVLDEIKSSARKQLILSIAAGITKKVKT